MSKIRTKYINNYLKKNNIASSQILDYKDKRQFDYYYFEDIPKGIALADSVILDKNGRLKYGFIKGFDGEEMRLITGYTGSGKSTRILLNDLMVAMKGGQSAIVTDISGQLIKYSYDRLKKMGVNIKILNFASPEYTDTYNPFYKEAVRVKRTGKISMETEMVIDKIVRIMIADTTGNNDKSWGLGAQSLMKGIFLTLFEEVVSGKIKPEEVTIYNGIQQFYWLADKVGTIDQVVRLSELDYYCGKNPASRSMQMIKSVCEIGRTTRTSYFAVVNANLSQFQNGVFYKLTSSNSLYLNELWEKQTVLFINTGGRIVGDLLTSIIVEQFYEEAIEVSARRLDNKLPIPIQIFLDEFANISFGDKNQFCKMLTTTRKMQVFFNLFIQSHEQITSKFGHEVATTILSNSSELFLGTKDYKTRRDFAISCGSKNIESVSNVYNDSINFTSVPLITPEQLIKMPKGSVYMIRNGYDLIGTYFEAVFNSTEFVMSENFKLDYSNKKQYDYESNVLLQPVIVSKVDLRRCSAKYLTELLSDDEINYLIDAAQGDGYHDYLANMKFTRMGIIQKEKDSYKLLVSLNNLKEAVFYRELM